MSWEYRVVRDTETSELGPHKELTHGYSVEQIFSDQEYRHDTLSLRDLSRDELLTEFQAMQQALTKPVLAWQDGRFVEVEEAIVKSEIDKQAEVGKG